MTPGGGVGGSNAPQGPSRSDGMYVLGMTIGRGDKEAEKDPGNDTAKIKFMLTEANLKLPCSFDPNISM